MKPGKLWSAVLSAAMVMGTTVPILAADMDGKLVVIHTNDIHGYYATAEEKVKAEKCYLSLAKQLLD